MISQFQLGQASMGASAQTAALRRTSAALAAASTVSAPVASPARSMVGKLAKAFGGRGSAAAAPAADSWEEF
jgi:methyl-accepting chemotaxis protein